MNDIKSFFSVGTIKIRSRDGHVIYYVKILKDLTTTIIPHFEKYRLLTQKKVDFELFKQIVFMMNNKEHLTPEGLRKIISIRASLNKGLGETISAYFPDIIPIDRPSVDEAKISDPQWFAGFASAEGCFTLSIYKAPSYKLGKTCQLTFIVTQHIRDKLLIKYLINYLDCGIFNERKGVAACDFKVRSIADLNQKIIPFFDKYPIMGVKAQAYADFCRAGNLIDKKSHLTKEGLDEILEIKKVINKVR